MGHSGASRVKDLLMGSLRGTQSKGLLMVLSEAHRVIGLLRDLQGHTE
jgi:hypothetical protein